jgi:glycerol-3-phosphate dehydrogenase
VELAGALKNVYAIAAGVADGLGFENNTRASASLPCSHLALRLTEMAFQNLVLITRGLSEMTRIGAAYGASPLTFLGLAGVGDLFLTCSSPASRNYTVGYRLGRGESLPDIIRTLGSVAEGVTTAKALHELLEELGTGVNASIATAVSLA